MQRDLPPALTSRIIDPIDALHPFIIERIIQSHFCGDALAVGPKGVHPQWMACQFTTDLKNKYPVRFLMNELTIGCLEISI